MEPISTAILVSFAIELAKNGIVEFSKSSGKKISDSAFKWITKLFYKEDKQPKKILEDLKLNSESLEAKNSLVAIIQNDVKDDPIKQEYLAEIIENYRLNYFTEINKSKNVNTGNINTEGGDVRLGDNYGK